MNGGSRSSCRGCERDLRKMRTPTFLRQCGNGERDITSLHPTSPTSAQVSWCLAPQMESGQCSRPLLSPRPS